MKKANMYISSIMLIIFILHAISASIELLGLNYEFIHIITTVLAISLCATFLVHLIMSAIMIGFMVRNLKKKEGYFFKLNNRLIIKMIFGLIIIIFVTIHIIVFVNLKFDRFNVSDLDKALIISNMIIVMLVASHATIGIKELFSSWGIENKKARISLLIITLAACILYITSFILYYTSK